MRPDLQRLTNAITPFALNAVDEGRLRMTLRAARDFNRTVTADATAPLFGATSLDAALAALMKNFEQRIKSYPSSVRAALNWMAATSFIKLIEGYRLTHADLNDIVSLSVGTGLYKTEYAATLPNHKPHYEGAVSQTRDGPLRFHATNFCVLGFPLGTVHYDAAELPLDQALLSRCFDKIVPQTKRRSPAGVWNIYSGFIPHGAPDVPASREDALSLCADLPQNMQDLVLNETDMWRLHANASIRFRDHTITTPLSLTRPDEVRVGTAILPETLQAIAPNWASLACAPA